MKFETYLDNERRKMEVFRLRETKEFLSIDELKEKCDTTTHFMKILEVDIWLENVTGQGMVIQWFINSRNPSKRLMP